MRQKKLCFNAQLHSILAAGVLCINLTPSSSWANILQLSDYLNEVKEKNTSYKSSISQRAGNELKKTESELITTPTLAVSAVTASDSAPSLQYSMYPGFEKSLNKNVTFALSQNTNFGLNAKVGYSLNTLEIKKSVPHFNQGSPSIELNQSLLRNAWGREIRAAQSASQAAIMASSYAETFKQKALFIQAETTYRRLAFARASVAIQKEALLRAKKILEWSSRRAHLQLGEKADELQAQVAYESRELQLQAALDEEKSACRALNSLRNSAQDTINEELSTPSADEIKNLKIPSRAAMRDDTLAQQEVARAAQASAQLNIEKNKPQLNLFANYALTSSRDADWNTAITDSLKTQYPSYSIGVRFSSPIDFMGSEKIRNGYKGDIDANEFALQRKLFEQETDWNDLTHHLEQAQNRHEIARKIELTSAERLKQERDRLSRGRTTTFQELQAEQDYAQAQLTRVQLATEVLQVYAQLKLFQETK